MLIRKNDTKMTLLNWGRTGTFQLIIEVKSDNLQNSGRNHKTWLICCLLTRRSRKSNTSVSWGNVTETAFAALPRPNLCDDRFPLQLVTYYQKKQLYVQVIDSILMTIGRNKMKGYRKAKKTVDVSVGESVRIVRELQELSQNELANITGIPQSTISGIENDRINVGVERAKVLARALKCHPAVLVFPGWEIKDLEAA